MAASNTDPIFSRTADIQFSSSYITEVSSGTTLGSTVYATIFTSDATNGGFVSKVRLRAVPQLTTSATVFRLWINNGSATTSSSNSAVYDELSLPATTGSSNAATANYEIPVNIALPPGYKLIGTIGSSSTNGWQATAIGGKY